MLGDEHTSIPEVAGTWEAWVSPGGYTRTWEAWAEPEQGGMPGSVTEIDE